MEDTVSFIYALCDPDFGEFKYIGQSINPRQRLSTHIAESKSSYYKDTTKSLWITSLLNQGKRPELFILCEGPIEEIDGIEKAWIERIKNAGYDLLNGKHFHGYNHTNRLKK